MLFGTDGIRGQANVFPIIPEHLIKIGRAVALYFKNFKKQAEGIALNQCFFPYQKHIHDPQQLTVVIGKDTRLSGYMIENALASGLTSQGANVVFLGPLPTPAIAMLVRSLRADVGIMISASHNPYQDNGIKFFDHHGFKLTVQAEKMIETLVQQDSFPHETCGGALRLDDASGRYIEFAKSTFPKNIHLEGMKIVLDCANGAAYKVAPKVFWELGAMVITLGDHPNGRNINNSCGALYPDLLKQKVQEAHADIGIALDGDADRIVVVTPQGQIIDGDQILALLACFWKGKGTLTGPLVSTCMSNQGLKNFLIQQDIEYAESAVGDKNVVRKMLETHSNLGGEESGHIILGDLSTTGDGIVAALQILNVMKERQCCADDLFPVFQEVPCRLFNFKLADDSLDLDAFMVQGQKWLGGEGKLVIRKSGTEPVLRVMVQHKEIERISWFFNQFSSQFNLKCA